VSDRLVGDFTVNLHLTAFDELMPQAPVTTTDRPLHRVGVCQVAAAASARIKPVPVGVRNWCPHLVA
jgi:hypothetical protein